MSSACAPTVLPGVMSVPEGSAPSTSHDVDGPPASPPGSAGGGAEAPGAALDGGAALDSGAAPDPGTAGGNAGADPPTAAMTAAAGGIAAIIPSRPRPRAGAGCILAGSTRPS